MRVFVGCLLHETNVFSPIPTGLAEYAIAGDPGVSPDSLFGYAPGAEAPSAEDILSHIGQIDDRSRHAVPLSGLDEMEIPAGFIARWPQQTECLHPNSPDRLG